MVINDPAVVAELRAIYPSYEKALVENDVDTLMSLFWNSPHAVRMGLGENLYGFDEISAFRKGRAPVNLARTVKRLEVVALGTDCGSITLEFERKVEGKLICGRQSQIWVRLPEGWRIAAAHVSLLA